MISFFNGFSENTVSFLRNLKLKNNAVWFNENKQDYEKHILNPAKDFVIVMGEKLKNISPEIYAIPKINKSLFRINRDTRFSKNKTPYKTNLGIYFWEGERKRIECPGFYFHLQENKFFLGVGMHIFPKNILEKYRDSVINKKNAVELNKIITNIQKSGNYTTGNLHYKKIPRGYEAVNENEKLLKYNGLFSMYEEKKLNKLLFTEKIIDFCYEKFKDMTSLHFWLVKNLK